jgi:sigma-B regulation protein RsbU (phosphoserine phosphatase)
MKLSIRYKILLIIIFLTLCSVGVMLTVSVKTFEKDKIAYVYDTNLQLSKSISTQISTEIYSTFNGVKVILQDYINTGSFSDFSKTAFDSDKSIVNISVYDLSQGQVLKQLQKDGYDAQNLINFQFILSQLQAKNSYKVYNVNKVGSSTTLALVEKFKNTNTNQELVFVVIKDFKQLFDSFRAPKSQEILLINADVDTLIDAGVGDSNVSNSLVKSELKKKISSLQGSGQIFELKSGSKILLSSLVPVLPAGLYVVALVDKNLALSAIAEMVKRSILFALLLFGVIAFLSLIVSGQLTTALLKLTDAVNKFSAGKFDTRVQIKSSDEVGLLANGFNLMATRVTQLMSESVEKARMEGELKTAKTVQETLFPSENLNLSWLRIAGFYEPASECGGDWWYYSIINEDLAYLWIGDATGHGAAAALLTSAARSAASLVEASGKNAAESLAMLNKALYDVSKGKLMMTFFLAIYNRKTKMLTYSNASHDPPFLLRYKEGVLKKKDLEPLNENVGNRLGQSSSSEYQVVQVQLASKDRIFFYTDGLADVANLKNEPWGERECLKTFLKLNENFTDIFKIRDDFVTTFQDFRQKKELKDDVTFFTLEIGE